jgi:hypothetical protein
VNTRGSKKPSFSTKPVIVKKNTPSSRAEVEKRIREKHEARKKQQAVNTEPRANNVSKRVFSDKSKTNPIESKPQVVKPKPDDNTDMNKKVLHTTDERKRLERLEKLKIRDAKNDVIKKEKERIEKLRLKEMRKAERAKRMNEIEGRKITPAHQPAPIQQPQVYVGKQQKPNSDAIRRQNHARQIKQEEERLRKHRESQQKHAQQKTVSRNAEQRDQIIKERLANRPVVNNFAMDFEELKFRKKSDSVFIVAGGPSLIGFDFNKLNGYDTIAVNKSIEFIKDPTYFITVDYTFMNKTKVKISDISKQRKTATVFVAASDMLNLNDKGMFVDSKHNITYSRLNEFNLVIKSNKAIDEKTGFGTSVSNFTRGHNSGFCAIQMAILLGYEKIYLLGFDMNLNTNKTHFHDGYASNSNIEKNIEAYKEITMNALRLSPEIDRIYSCSPTSSLNELLQYIEIDAALKNTKKIDLTQGLDSLIIVGYYTIDTPYEEEAKVLIDSCRRLGLNHDIIGVKSLGDWQSNTRFKAKFMLDMLNKHPNMRLLYVDCDAEIHSLPNLFINYSTDIAVRFQDFSYRKNECLSGTIYMENNLRTRKLCELWFNSNKQGNQNGLEQWNLGILINQMIKEDGLRFKNLPPEYTFIFDTMKRIYPDIKPIIEHYQASRKYKRKV